jgi:hypothetical protein
MAEIAVRNVDGVLADARDLAQALIAPGAAEIDRESRFPVEHLSALGQIGALGLLVPREQGGVGARVRWRYGAARGTRHTLAIERHRRDARAGAVMAPANGVLRTWSAKAIARLPVP